jgi:uncharacterized protein (DUF2147 family)
MEKLIAVSILILGFSWQLLAQDDVVGKYYSPDKQGKIEIYKMNGKYLGRTICCDTSRKDVHNPDSSLRGRSRIGVVFLFDFEYDGKGIYQNGKVYNLDDGKTYDALMWMEDNELKVRGYMGNSLLGKTVSFERI